MAELVTDCPRCGVRQITFDVTQAHVIPPDYVPDYPVMPPGYIPEYPVCDFEPVRSYEIFCVCRNCKLTVRSNLEVYPRLR